MCYSLHFYTSVFTYFTFILNYRISKIRLLIAQCNAQWRKKNIFEVFWNVFCVCQRLTTCVLQQTDMAGGLRLGRPRAILIITGWLYQLIQKHLQIYYTKLHYIDLYGPLMSLSHMDIWYLVSNNPKICQKSWEMTSRKKGKIFRVASIWHIFWSTDS